MEYYELYLAVSDSYILVADTVDYQLCQDWRAFIKLEGLTGWCLAITVL